MINPCVIEKYIVNVTRKITAEFHKVTPVKSFISCLISMMLKFPSLDPNENCIPGS